MDLVVIALAFGAIFIVELPDKTFIATLVLSTRFRPLFVNGAFAMLCGLSGSEDILARDDVLTFLDEETRARPDRAWRLVTT